MQIQVTVELHNGAYRGNTAQRTIEIDEEDRCSIDDLVEEEVLANIVGWDWKEL